MSKAIIAWQGDTIPVSASDADPTAEVATLLVGTAGNPAVFTKLGTFTDGVADLTITDEENIQATLPLGIYKYMVEVTYSDGSVLSYPDSSACRFEDLPDFIIKKRIQG